MSVAQSSSSVTDSLHTILRYRGIYRVRPGRSVSHGEPARRIVREVEEVRVHRRLGAHEIAKGGDRALPLATLGGAQRDTFGAERSTTRAWMRHGVLVVRYRWRMPGCGSLQVSAARAGAATRRRHATRSTPSARQEEGATGFALRAGMMGVSELSPAECNRPRLRSPLVARRSRMALGTRTCLTGPRSSARRRHDQPVMVEGAPTGSVGTGRATMRRRLRR